jgi:hypothetical protein
MAISWHQLAGSGCPVELANNIAGSSEARASFSAKGITNKGAAD